MAKTKEKPVNAIIVNPIVAETKQETNDNTNESTGEAFVVKEANIIEKESLYTNLKDIDNAVTAVNIAGQAVVIEYQRVACSVLLHLAQHKDIRVLNRLIDTIPEGLRKQSMRAFFYKFAPLSVDDKKAFTITKGTELDSHGYLKIDLAKALKTKWWLAAGKEADAVELLDPVKSIEAIIKKAGKFLASNNPDKKVLGGNEAVAVLTQTVNMLNTIYARNLAQADAALDETKLAA